MRAAVRYVSVVVLYLGVLAAVSMPNHGYYAAKSNFTEYWRQVRAWKGTAAALVLAGMVGIILTEEDDA